MGRRWTVAAVLSAAEEHLDKRDVASARLEAELLLAHSLRLSRIDLYVQFDRPLDEVERGAFKDLIRQRLTGKPLQYITGRQAFRRLTLRVEPGVFIPRPETELLVEKVIDALAKTPGSVAIAELGFGSGAISLSLAQELLDARVWAVDISTKAVAVARANAAAHNLEDKVEFVHGDLFEALPSAPAVGFDAIIANPPYIPTAEISGLQAEVKDFEPDAALDGGPDGLDFYARITKEAPSYLKDGGLVAFEVGLGQAGPVAGLLTRAGFSGVTVYNDYNNIERIVMAKVGDMLVRGERSEMRDQR